MRQTKYEVYYNINDYFHDRFQSRCAEAFWKTVEVVQHVWAEQSVFRVFRDVVEVGNKPRKFDE